MTRQVLKKVSFCFMQNDSITVALIFKVCGYLEKALYLFYSFVIITAANQMGMEFRGFMY